MAFAHYLLAVPVEPSPKCPKSSILNPSFSISSKCLNLSSTIHSRAHKHSIFARFYRTGHKAKVKPQEPELSVATDAFTQFKHMLFPVTDRNPYLSPGTRQDIHHLIKPEEVELVRRDYMANEGWETFLSYEDIQQDIFVGLLRLQKCGLNTTCPELMGKCYIVRELHVYGTAVPVHGRDAAKLQHQGYGTLLMEEAERIARREHRSTKIAVISGVGIIIGKWDMSLKGLKYLL